MKSFTNLHIIKIKNRNKQMKIFNFKLGLCVLVCLFCFQSIKSSYARDCTYIKNIEIKNEKIFKSVTEYKCQNRNEKSELKNTSKVIVSPKSSILKIKSKNKFNKTSNRVVSHSEYMNMIYFSKPRFLKKPNGKLESFLYPILRILLVDF